MIGIIRPVFFIVFIPIVCVEWEAIQQADIKCTNGRKLCMLLVSNAVSSFLGIPIAWSILVAIQMIIPGGDSGVSNHILQSILQLTLQAPWVLPDPSKEYWLIPAVFTVLLIPFFFVSYWVESWVNFLMIKKSGGSFSEIKKATLKANIWSYALLFILSIAFLLFQVRFGY